MNNLNEYRDAILGWARDRNLIEGSSPEKQLDKLFEELGGYAGASALSANPPKRDEMLLKVQKQYALGNTFALCCILAEQMGVPLDFFEMDEYTEVPRNGVLYLTMGCLAGLVESVEQNLVDDIIGQEEHFYFAVAVAKVIAEKNGFDFMACVEMAWNEIKDHKGRMVDGIFVKESDL